MSAERGRQMSLKKGFVVQFNENHKWCGSLGIVAEVQEFGTDIRYMVGVPIPQKGTAYIYVMESDDFIEPIGKAALTIADKSEVDE